MVFSIRTKIILIAITILFFPIGANTFISSYIFTREYANSLKSRGFVIAENLKLQLDRLLRLGINIENLLGFDEQCRDIIKKYEDISYAMIVDINGKILFHNDSSQHNKHINDQSILESIKTSDNIIKNSSKNDNTYYNVILPVFDDHNENVAAIILGFPRKLILQKIENLIIYSTGIFLFFSHNCNNYDDILYVSIGNKSVK
jgi:sensor histidine kinase regulating citrate/malate metabolism